MPAQLSCIVLSSGARVHHRMPGIAVVSRVELLEHRRHPDLIRTVQSCLAREAFRFTLHPNSSFSRKPNSLRRRDKLILKLKTTVKLYFVNVCTFL